MKQGKQLEEGKELEYKRTGLFSSLYCYYWEFVYLIGRSIGGDRTVKVHGHLDKEDEQFLPGMFVKAFIEIADNPVNALPEQAIVRSGGKHYIYILKEKRIENNQEVTASK